MWPQHCRELSDERAQRRRPAKELIQVEPAVRVMARLEPEVAASLSGEAE